MADKLENSNIIPCVLRIEDIKEISNMNRYNNSPGFSILTKEGDKIIISFSDAGTNDINAPYTRAQKAMSQIKKAYLDFNKIPIKYRLVNNAFFEINGATINAGCWVEDDLGNTMTLTQKEIDELAKEFRIVDTGIRTLLFISMLKIEEFEITHPKRVPQRYIDQLIYMGYDVSKLKYELE